MTMRLGQAARQVVIGLHSDLTLAVASCAGFKVMCTRVMLPRALESLLDMLTGSSL